MRCHDDFSLAPTLYDHLRQALGWPKINPVIKISFVPDHLNDPTGGSLLTEGVASSKEGGGI